MHAKIGKGGGRVEMMVMGVSSDGLNKKSILFRSSHWLSLLNAAADYNTTRSVGEMRSQRQRQFKGISRRFGSSWTGSTEAWHQTSQDETNHKKKQKSVEFRFCFD